MFTLGPDAAVYAESKDVLARFRARIVYLLAGAAVVILLPFALSEFFLGRPILGAAGLAVAVVLGINALAVHWQRSLTMPLAALVLGTAAVIGIAISTRGVLGALWSYPAMLLFFALLPLRLARVAGGGLLALASGLAYTFVGFDFALRFAVTLALTIVTCNIFVRLAADLQARLADQAIKDSLTGAFNRRYMDTVLSQAAERLRRHKSPASVLVLNLDHFKQVNEKFGEAAADGVLQGLAAFIRMRARKLDVLFRPGGDQFLVLLPETTEPNAVVAAEHLRSVVASSRLLPGWPLTVSIGVSELQPDEPVDAWVKHAEDAVRRAKAAGGDQVIRRQPAAPALVSEPVTQSS